MNDHLLLGLVLAAVAAWFYLIYRSARRVQQHCPACHCCGQGAHCGRFVCASCGARFVLDGSGRPCQGISDVVPVPVFILVLAVGALVMTMFTGASAWHLYPLATLVLVAFALWEIRQALREKAFRSNNNLG